MTDPISTAVTIVGLLNNALGLLKGTKELAKNSGNAELKERLSELQDHFLDLKDRILDLKGENDKLREKLDQQQNIRRSGEFGYFFNGAESDPLCPVCYERDGKPIHLPKAIPWSGGIMRLCKVCDHQFWEKPQQPQGVARTRSSWME